MAETWEQRRTRHRKTYAKSEPEGQILAQDENFIITLVEGTVNVTLLKPSDHELADCMRSAVLDFQHPSQEFHSGPPDKLLGIQLLQRIQMYRDIKELGKK